MSYPADKVKFTDGWTDGRTDGWMDRCRQQQYPFGLKVQGVKTAPAVKQLSILLSHKAQSPHWSRWDINLTLGVGINYQSLQLIGNLTKMTSCHGNDFCITDPIWGESTGDWWLPLTKTSKVEFWCVSPLDSRAVELTVELSIIWDAMMLMWDQCNSL